MKKHFILLAALFLIACERKEVSPSPPATPVPIAIATPPAIISSPMPVVKVEPRTTPAPPTPKPLPDFDIIAGTLNGEPLSELTADKVTDLFGRPSATTEPGVSPGFKSADREIPEIMIPSTIVYGDRGLIFRFRHPRSDPQQGIASILIYLSQQSDKDSHTMMKPFTGTLSRGIDGNWKAKHVMDEFAEFSPKDHYDPKRVQELRTLNEMLKTIGGDRSDSVKNTISFMLTVDLTTPQTFVSFKYEEQTKFLEWIDVGPKRKDAK